MPEDYPDYPEPLPDRRLLRRLRRPLRAAREDPLPDRGRERRAASTAEWEVDGEGRRRRERETNRYRAVLVANGHHWDPRWPEPPFPGSDGSPASRSTPTTTASPTCCGASGCWCWASATRPPTSRSSPRGSPSDLPGDAPRRLRPAQVHERHADRRTASPLLTRLPLAVQRFFIVAHARPRDRRHDRLRPARARPQAARGAPDRLRRAAHPARPRRHRGEAEHRALRRRPHGPLRRRQRGGDRPRRLLHRLQDHLPVPRPSAGLGRRTTSWPSTAGSPRSTTPASTSSA